MERSLMKSKASNNKEALEKILEAREWRWHHRKELVAKYRKPILTITLNIPGPDKTKNLYKKAFKYLIKDFKKNKISILHEEYRQSFDGPEAYLVVEHDTISLKKMCILFEDTHPLGRIADFDVLSNDDEVVSRKDLDKTERKCLLCERPATDCIISRRHSIEDLLTKIDEIIKDFLQQISA